MQELVGGGRGGEGILTPHFRMMLIVPPWRVRAPRRDGGVGGVGAGLKVDRSNHGGPEKSVVAADRQPAVDLRARGLGAGLASNSAWLTARRVQS